VYVLAFVFWAESFVMMARHQGWYQIMAAEVTAKLVCGLCFLLLPTTNVRPDLQGDGLGVWLLGLVYRMDRPTNLFPSIHCMDSWICFLGLCGRKDLPKAYRVFTGVFALAVCISTLTTRQHVLADVVAGILLAQGTMALSRWFHWGGWFERCFVRLDRKLFGNTAS
jgi:membrane-associated phospholipid phosphatase